MFRFGDPGGRIYGTAGTSNANIINYWGNGTGNLYVDSGGGRNTGSNLHISLNFSTALYKFLDNQQIWGIACAFKYSASVNVDVYIISFLDRSSNQCELYLSTNNKFYITRNGTVLGTTANSYNPNTWYHIEFKVKIDPTVGTVELRINEEPVIVLTGQNTRATSNSYANTLRLGSYGLGGQITVEAYFDDIIIWDSQTTDPAGNSDIHDFVGDCVLNWSLPNGAGSSTQFTPNAGSNYNQVADSSIDGDTSYVEDGTLNDIDSYSLEDLPANTQSVLSVATIHYARKTDVGGKQITPLIRTGATNYLHSQPIYLPDSYLYQFRNWGQNPNTLANWTKTDVNGLEIGQKVSS